MLSRLPSLASEWLVLVHLQSVYSANRTIFLLSTTTSYSRTSNISTHVPNSPTIARTNCLLYLCHRHPAWLLYWSTLSNLCQRVRECTVPADAFKHPFFAAQSSIPVHDHCLSPHVPVWCGKHPRSNWRTSSQRRRDGGLLHFCLLCLRPWFSIHLDEQFWLSSRYSKHHMAGH